MAAIRATGSLIGDIVGVYVSIRDEEEPARWAGSSRTAEPSAGLAAGTLLLVHAHGLADAGGGALQLARGLLGARHDPLRGARALDALRQRLPAVGQPLVDAHDLGTADRASPVEQGPGPLGDEVAGAED